MSVSRLRRFGLPVALCWLLAPAPLVPAAAAQIPFRANVESAVAEAQRDDRPLMFLVIDRQRSGYDRWERRMRRTLADDDVAAASRLFVPVELPAQRLPREAAHWNLNPRQAEGAIVFTTPRGRKVHASSAGDPERLVRDMLAGYEAFCEYIWDYEVADALVAADTPAERRIELLERVARHGIRAAEPDLVSLCRRNLPEGVRAAAYRAMASLSTPRCVELLVGRADHDTAAGEALKACTPVGAEEMLPWIDDADAQRRAAVYAAVVAICEIRSPKAERFWESSPEARRLAEIRRVRAATREAAMAYRRSTPWVR